MLKERAELRFPVSPFTLDVRFLNQRFESLKNLPRQKDHLSVAATATQDTLLPFEISSGKNELSPHRQRNRTKGWYCVGSFYPLNQVFTLLKFSMKLTILPEKIYQIC